MGSVEQLLRQHLVPGKTTVIQSPLGRKPSLIFYYMEKSFPEWTVVYRPFDEEDRPHDVVIWFEPPFEAVIDHAHRTCLIVLSSHGYLTPPEGILTPWLERSYDGLLRSLTPACEWRDVILPPMLFRHSPLTELARGSQVYVEVQRCQQVHAFYLYFLNALDNLLYYEDCLGSWTLSEKAIPLLQRYVDTYGTTSRFNQFMAQVLATLK